MRGNLIPRLTWRWIKANDTLIEIPELNKKDFNLYEDRIVDDTDMNEEFMDKSYGVSEELLKINGKYRNWDNYLSSSDSDKYYRLNLCGNNNILNDRQRIHLKEGESLTLIFDYFQEEEDLAFRNSIFEILLEKDAKLNLFISQRLGKKALSYLSLVGSLKENSNLNLVNIEIGASENYVNLLGDLKEENANFQVKSSYMGFSDNKIDLAYKMSHSYKNTKSNMYLSGVLKDESKKRFIGTLDFKEGSKASKAREEEFVTLLDDGVKSRTIPLLLSHEADIIGEHAASAGKIDEDLLYYIMTRGFSKNEAKILIVESRINPIVDLIPNEDLRNSIKDFIRKGILN